MKNLDSGVGVYAADSASYQVFAALFDPIINEYHGGFGPNDKHPPSDFGETRLDELADLDPEGKFIKSTRSKKTEKCQNIKKLFKKIISIDLTVNTS